MSAIRFLARELDVRRVDDIVYVANRQPLVVPVRNVVEWVARWRDSDAGRPFMAEREGDGWRVLTFGEAYEAVTRIAGGLLASDHAQTGIAVAAANSLAHVQIVLGCHLAGVPVTALGPRLAKEPSAQDRLQSSLAATGATALFVNDRETRDVVAAREGMRDIEVHSLDSSGAGSWTEMLRAPFDAGLWHPSRLPAGDRVAKFFFTSGTSGAPKCVPNTFAAMAAAQAMTASTVEDEVPLRSLDWMPWHHTMGGNISVGRALQRGGTLFIDDGSPSGPGLARSLENARKTRPTHLSSAPVYYAALVSELERDPAWAAEFFGAARLLSYGGAPLAEDVAARLRTLAREHADQPAPLTSGYGATETCGPALFTYWVDPVPGSIGLPCPGVTAKLRPLGDDRFELLLSGPNLFGGYHHDPAPLDEEGFYPTGDAVRFAEPDDIRAGLVFAGRRSEEFKLANGTWVRPRELAASLAAVGLDGLGGLVVCGEGRQEPFAIGWPAARSSLDVQALRDRLSRFNSGRSQSSKVARLLVLQMPPSADAGEVTDKGSLNGRLIAERRKALVDELCRLPLDSVRLASDFVGLEC